MENQFKYDWFIFATGNRWNTTTSQVSKINMNTSSNAGAATSMVGTKHRATAMSKDFNFAYVHGGGNSSRIVKYNLNTEANQFSTTHPGGTQNNPASSQAATVGHIKTGDARSFDFPTEAFRSWPDAPGTDGTNKTLSSRDGFAYWNTGGGYRTSSDWHLRSTYTGGRLANISKNGITTGEESITQVMIMDLFVGSMMVTQNNNGYLFTYASHTLQETAEWIGSGPPGHSVRCGCRVRTLMYGYTGF